jgi:hypothetical protein
MLGKLTNELIQSLLVQLKSKDNQDKLENEVINPILFIILKRIAPYFFLVCGLFLITLILEIIILYFIMKKNVITSPLLI